jgi:ribosome silencing factor RsfS/YbeB/iojap
MNQRPPFAPAHKESRTIARKPTAPPPSPPPPSPPIDGEAAPAKPVRKRAAPRKAAAPVAAGIPASPGTPRKKAAAAGPRKATRQRERAEPSRLDQIQGVILASLEDDKAENIVTLDLAGRASFADRMVIATGIVDRQISAMATHLEDKLEEIGLKRVQIEGMGGSDWVLIDAGDIVIHLFKAEARELYGLEKMWGPDLDEAETEAG